MSDYEFDFDEDVVSLPNKKSVDAKLHQNVRGSVVIEQALADRLEYSRDLSEQRADSPMP
jgi:hypothetical protein